MNEKLKTVRSIVWIRIMHIDEIINQIRDEIVASARVYVQTTNDDDLLTMTIAVKKLEAAERVKA
jgi:hypothetical protein